MRRQPTFVTVYPNGEARPFSSNLNPVPGAAIPNLVLARVGLGGAVNIYNNTGSVHLVADVVGYFMPGSDVGLEPLLARRDCWTRATAPVASLGAVGPGQTVDLQVTGVGRRLRRHAQAVALNITATQPTDGSFLTVWPTGRPRPLASSVNMVAGADRAEHGARPARRRRQGQHLQQLRQHRTSSSMSSAASPSAHRRSSSPSRRFACLDTREGVGAPLARLARGELALPLAGRRGVPAAGVTAVILNVTVVQPTDGTFVTVFPRAASGHWRRT